MVAESDREAKDKERPAKDKNWKPYIAKVSPGGVLGSKSEERERHWTRTLGSTLTRSRAIKSIALKYYRRPRNPLEEHVWYQLYPEDVQPVEYEG